MWGRYDRQIFPLIGITFSMNKTRLSACDRNCHIIPVESPHLEGTKSVINIYTFVFLHTYFYLSYSRPYLSLSS